MGFKARNPYYLRISERVVLPIYLYLDERHLEWMSDRILQCVIADLQPHILSKLRLESEFVHSNNSSAKNKVTVDTHRGDAYQFCYFLRKTSPHSLIVKTRDYTAVLPRTSEQVQQTRNPSKRKRESEGATLAAKEVRRKKKGKKVLSPSATPPGTDEDEVIALREMSIEGTRFNEGTDDVEPQLSIEIEDSEEKPKPSLHLTYQGFTIYGSCLCVVVEPWPPIQPTSRVATNPSEVSVIAPVDFAASSQRHPAVRGRTPLFLPDEEDTSSTRFQAPNLTDQATQLYTFDQDESHVYGGMMELSQLLTQVGDLSAAVADDDNEVDGAVFFGDADEVRELDGY